MTSAALSTALPSVLVVDDTPTNLDVMKDVLGSAYSVRLAISGAAALKLARQSLPDIVLLDVMMPDMDGYEVCRHFKADAVLAQVPVIFITSRDEPEDEERGFAAGAVDYITKPISPALVKARVANHLALSRRTREAEDSARRRAEFLFLMRDGFDAIEQAVLLVNDDFQIAFVNDRYLGMMELSADVCRMGANFLDVVWLLADRGEFGAGDIATVVEDRLQPVRNRQKASLLRVRPDGRIVAETGAPLPSGGYIYTFTDVTAERQAAERERTAGRATVMALASLAEFRDTDTGDHIARVARLTHEIARALRANDSFDEEISPDVLQHLGIASILHDIGKVAISDAILRKPGRFTPEERAVMETHTLVGAALLGKSQTMAHDSVYLRIATETARHHHEHYDGAGYPDGLAGKAIPLAARIVAVADVFDALTNNRPYKSAWSEAEAAAFLAEQKGKQFDPDVVNAALIVLEERRQTPVFSWTDTLSVGNEELDQDHRAIISLVNQLASPLNRDDRQVQEFVLNELMGYAVTHFAREEDHMRRIGYVGCDRHQAIHAALVDELTRIRSQFVTGSQEVGEVVWTFVADWLRHHIMQEDMGYVRHTDR
jgi:hemerythrin-like metal-binding protein